MMNRNWLLVVGALLTLAPTSCKPGEKTDKSRASDDSSDEDDDDNGDRSAKKRKKRADGKATDEPKATASAAKAAPTATGSATSQPDEPPAKDLKDAAEHADIPAKKDLGDDSPTKLTDKPVEAKPKAVALDVPNSRVRLTMPAGWRAKRVGEWWLLAPKNNTNAVFAFVEFDRPNESTRKIGEIARVLGTGFINWRSPKWYLLGPNRLQARTAQGSSGGWNVLYATINPGDSHQVLAVYATTSGVSKEDGASVRRILGSVRLR